MTKKTEECVIIVATIIDLCQGRLQSASVWLRHSVTPSISPLLSLPSGIALPPPYNNLINSPFLSLFLLHTQLGFHQKILYRRSCWCYFNCSRCTWWCWIYLQHDWLSFSEIWEPWAVLRLKLDLKILRNTGAAPGFFTQCDGDKQSSAEDLGHGMSDILMRHPATTVCSQAPSLDRLQWPDSATIQPPTSPAACWLSGSSCHLTEARAGAFCLSIPGWPWVISSPGHVNKNWFGCLSLSLSFGQQPRN